MGERLDRALDSVAEAERFAKSTYQTTVFQMAEALMGKPGGLGVLYERAHRFDAVGVFDGGPWVDPAKLQPPLVRGSLVATGVYPVVETLSELRMLAIATGRAESDAVTAAEAKQFLDEVMALNLSFLFPAETEQERIEAGPNRDSNIALFKLLADELSLVNLSREVLGEIEAVCAQRPIQTDRVRRMIEMASRIPETGVDPGVAQRLSLYRRAITGPSPMSRDIPSVRAYRKLISELDVRSLEAESIAFGRSMEQTGLVCPHHAVLLRRVIVHHPDLVPKALALTGVGAASVLQKQKAARGLVKVAIHPSTAQAVYGLSRLINRGLLQRKEIVNGLNRIVHLDFHEAVRKVLVARKKPGDGLTANAMLLAGCIQMLGQPLGIGQGHNPTCQAARGLSMWAQHAPGYLLGLLVSAARYNRITMHFEGAPLRSDLIEGGVARTLDPDLDPVSLVLVPHLDRLYDEMMRRVLLRSEDGHKWVNPGLYGRYVPFGFASIFQDIGQTTVAGYRDFVRRFYATHHPDYNDRRRMMYPNPLGLLVTNSRGDYLGPHAIALQRVARDPSGVLRAYFYNPNNEGRQDWGNGVTPSVHDNGELEGESSLPFEQLVSRIYAYHYQPYEVGDAYAVPDVDVARIEAAARASWGRAFAWAD
jgi:hypothetical protein